jgi:hypothetical protein
MPRSDSSKAFRKRLVDQYVILPDVWSKFSFAKYFNFANDLFDEANKSLKYGNLAQAYVQHYKFVKFSIENLRSHSDYRSPQHEKERLWLDQVSKKAIEALEAIVERMDREEDARRKLAQEMELIDMFDGDGDDMTGAVKDNNTATTAATAITTGNQVDTTLYLSKLPWNARTLHIVAHM